MILKLVFQVAFAGHLLCCFWMFVVVADESKPLPEITTLNWWTAQDLGGSGPGTLYIASLYVRSLCPNTPHNTRVS